MSDDVTDKRELERLLASVLSIGTWLASAAIAVGLILQCMDLRRVISALTCSRMISLGIALFIALPVLRVVLMTVAFVRRREPVFCAAALVVLTVIGAAACIGMRAG
jgi:uncharacterized membrane protein